MAFGSVMQMKVGELKIELAPLHKEAMKEFVTAGGMQHHSVTRYLGRRTAPVLEDEQDWFDRVREEKDSLIWGIWLIDGDNRQLIGTSGLHSIGGAHFRSATSGSMIFRKEHWRKGIAKHCHMARTWYGFAQLGLTQIRSAVMQGNDGSLHALQRSGYVVVATERNATFVDGRFHHQDNLECINPDAFFWDKWWGSDPVQTEFKEARTLTQEALAWAQAEVKLL
jgi:RimJ/RimL family protein N-acetyltransferase